MVTGSRAYSILLLGEEVACSSLHDAAAMQKASDILADMARVHPDDDLYELVALLLRYGQTAAAERLRNKAIDLAAPSTTH
jgi:hypothetical protein